MKMIRLALMLAVVLPFGVWGCGDACSAEESQACTDTFTSCTAGCADVACSDACAAADCDCHAEAGCDPGSSCP